jgi:hypothetical protein
MHADENNDGSIMVCEDDEGEIECSSPISLPSAPYDTLTTGGGRSGDGGSGGDGIGSSGQSAIAIEAGVTVRGGDGGQGGVSLAGVAATASRRPARLQLSRMLVPFAAAMAAMAGAAVAVRIRAAMAAMAATAASVYPWRPVPR